MKAYTIHKFYVCQITKEVIAQISFNDEAFDKILPTIEFANTYIGKSKRDWFLQSLETFISHKKKIIEHSQVSEEKQKALSVCIQAYTAYCEKSLETIVAGFLKGKKYFETILPHQSNDSHESSLNNLNELIKFCEQETIKTTTT